jgi:hypothetical protein
MQENHRACIAVRQKDGWPQMTFVTPGIDLQGRAIITSQKRVIIRVNIEKVGPQSIKRI